MTIQIQTDYLLHIYNAGNQTGQKVDPVSVSNSMRKARLPGGEPIFKVEDNLTSQQINKLLFAGDSKEKRHSRCRNWNPERLCRYDCRIAFTLFRYKRSSRMNVSYWNENPNKLIQKLLVSNKFYPGIMWQPGWTRSWTKLIPISCNILLLEHHALLSCLYTINFNTVEATTRF